MNEACDDDSSKQFCRIRQQRKHEKRRKLNFCEKMCFRGTNEPRRQKTGGLNLKTRFLSTQSFSSLREEKVECSAMHGEREIVAVDNGGNHRRVNEAWIFNEISKHPTKTSMLMWRVVRFTTWNNFTEFVESLIAHFFFRKRGKRRIFLLLI